MRRRIDFLERVALAAPTTSSSLKKKISRFIFQIITLIVVSSYLAQPKRDYTKGSFQLLLGENLLE